MKQSFLLEIQFSMKEGQYLQKLLEDHFVISFIALVLCILVKLRGKLKPEGLNLPFDFPPQQPFFPYK